MDQAKDGRTRSLYDADFYSWTLEQAEHLRSGRFDRLDVANLAEEIDSLGRAERSALMSSYRLICLHQLKRLFQPERAESRSWSQTITRERNNAEANLEDNPGLKPQRQALFERAYRHARREAAAETGLTSATFPVAPPFTVDQIEDHGYWPETGVGGLRIPQP